MGFGTAISMAVLAVSAAVLLPLGIRVEHVDQIALILLPGFGGWALPLFAVSLGIACFGAAQEIALEMAYLLAQTFGWEWGKDKRPTDTARFTAAHTAVVGVAVVLLLVGLDPLRTTVMSMALTAVTLPFTTLPFLVLMNDPRYVGDHRNHVVANVLVGLVSVLACGIALLAIPLQILGGG
jgi:Mn2+/Fe2+ NRAMP family transporter